MKYCILALIAVVALVAICSFGFTKHSKGKIVSAVSVPIPKVVTSTPEKVSLTKPTSYEVSFTAVVSSPTP